MNANVNKFIIKKFLVEQVARIAKIDKDTVDLECPFNLMGLTSLDGIELIDQINRKFYTNYSATILFDYPNLNSLCNFLASPKKTQRDISYQEASEKYAPIAIIGMACNFPHAKNLDEYWALLSKGENAITPIPEDRWQEIEDKSSYYGGFIDSPDSFDNEVFDLFERESKNLDPQQRKLMELSWHAIENAGYAPKELMGTNTGVYIGISSNDYSLAKIREKQSVDLYDGVGGAHSIAANRLSYFYNFLGPSLAIDTACSSSLIALAQGAGNLRSGECDMALVGGINILYTSHLTQAFTKAGMISPDGRCKTFSDDANGYVRGEGGGVLLLKRYDDAVRDNDHVWGVVKGFSSNQDGRSNGLTAPNGKAQVQVIKRAMEFSNFGVDDIDYVEAHGTGTPLGDPVEYHALKEVFRGRGKPLYLGSAKTNIGHLESAAGVAGVIKVLLSMNKGMLPKSINFKTLNKNIDATNSPLTIVQENQPFKRVLRAGVSSFGFGGSNAHAIFEGPMNRFKALQAFPLRESYPFYPLAISASSQESLKSYISAIVESLKKLDEASFPSFCYRLNNKMSALKFRTSIVCESRSDAIEKLEALLEKSFYKKERVNNSYAFAFTGQGVQSPHMHRDLYHHIDVYRKNYDLVKDKFIYRHSVDFNKMEDHVYETNYAQVSLFCFEYALYQTILTMNLTSDFFLGHSLGEIVAYTCAGGLSLDDAVDLVFYRGQCMQKSQEGGMITIFRPSDDVEDLLKKEDIHLSIAAINTKQSTVVSGVLDEIENLISFLEKENINYKKLPVKQGFHSYLMDEVLAEFKESIDHIQYKDTPIPVLSSLHGDVMSVDNVDSNYWVRQMRETTHFCQSIIKLVEYNINQVVEIGPHPTLVHMIREVNGEQTRTFYPQVRNEHGLKSFFHFFGQLFQEGQKASLREICFDKSHHFVDTPNLVFDRKVLNFASKNDLEKTEEMKLSVIDIEQRICAIVAEQLDVAPEEIDRELPVMNFGADSLILLSVLDAIRDDFHVSIAVADVFQDLGTVRLMANHVAENFGQEAFEKSTKEVVKHSPGSVPEEIELQGKGVLGSFRAKGMLQSEETSADPNVQNIIDEFVAKTKSSKDLSQKFRRFLADNRVSAGFRPHLKEMVYPIVWEKAKGAYFWDFDGNRFIDFTMGFGVNLFGHSPDFIQKAIEKQLTQGMAVGPQSHLAGEVATLLCELTGMERVAFLNSGTEAVMTCIRLARARTKREKIVVFEGSYHGHFDGVLGRSNRKDETVPVAAGVPSTLTMNLKVLEYGTQKSLDYIKANASELAAVLIEPVQSRYPELQPKEFLKDLREITKKSQTALIFDEVITGFRVGAQGAQAYFDVKADMACYGKVLGGGMPIGAVAGAHEYLDFIDGGEWSFGDGSIPLNEITFFAGTFCKHPLAMAASLAVLKKIQEEGKSIFADLNSKTAAMAKTLNDYFTAHGDDLRIVYFSSLFRFKFSGNMDLLFYFLNMNNIYVWEGRNMFISTAHTQEDIDKLVDVIKSSVDKMRSLGLLRKSGPKKLTEDKALLEEKKLRLIERQMTPYHERFVKMSQESELGALACMITVSIELKGNYLAETLIESIEDIAHRHPSLQAAYDVSEKKIVFNSLEPVYVNLIDFTDLAEEEAQQTYAQWSESMSTNAFDLKKNCVEISVLKMTNDCCVISFRGHHLALDGLSLAMLSYDIADTYSYKTGHKKKNKISEISFIDFLDRKSQEESSYALKEEQDIAYWQEQYSSLPPALFERTSYRGGRVAFDLTKEESTRVKFFGYKNKSSLMNTLLKVLLDQLYETMNIEDAVVGIPMFGHENITDSMVGNCVNLMPFRLKYQQEANVAEAISEIKTYQLQCFKHSRVPYEKVCKRLGRDVIDIVLNVEPLNELPKFGDLKAKLLTEPCHASEYPIYINAMKVDDKINITMDYQHSALKSDDEAKAFLNRYVEMLLTMAS